MRIGLELLGEVDRIAEVGSIKTKFFTFMFIPLFPEYSYFVIQGTETPDKPFFFGLGWIDSGQYRAIQVPLNIRSILKAYIQRITILFSLIWGAMLIFDPSPILYVRQRDIIIEILSVILFIISCRINRATETRKEQILAYLQKKGTEESKPEHTIREEPAARLEEIESALKSGDPTERAWALNELETLPAKLANELRHKYE